MLPSSHPKNTQPQLRTRVAAAIDRPQKCESRGLGKAATIKVIRISPHSLRHAFATLARDAGARLEDIQDALDHADPRTTRRYDRGGQRLDRSPAYTLAAYLTGH